MESIKVKIFKHNVKSEYSPENVSIESDIGNQLFGPWAGVESRTHRSHSE